MSLGVRDIDLSRERLPSRWLVVLLSAAAVACSYQPDVPDKVIDCTGAAQNACPEQYYCVPLGPGQAACCRTLDCSGAPDSDGGATTVNPGDPPGGRDAPEADSPGNPTDGGPRCPADSCSPGALRCGEGKIETCVMVEGCGAWGAGLACPDSQVCTGAEGSARCGCPEPPAGCEGGGGTRCESPGVALTCMTSEARCVVAARRVTCPLDQPCTGAFPGARCSNCPAPPPECQGRAGRFCNATGQIVECVNDPQTSCLTLTPARACDGGKSCAGQFPDAGCGCGARNVGQPCGMCGGTITCDGSCSLETPPNHGQGCSTCGGTIQCGGACSAPNPPNLGLSCDSCGGTVKCDGTCSVPNPPGYGQPCGRCNGVTKCDGTCSVVEPPNLGAMCGACGGTVRCDGSCSADSPEPRPCGRCGGMVQCDGACSIPTPPNLEAPCGQCGGLVKCDGSCSVPTPGDLGQPCGRCGGRVLCGGCSVPTPQNWGDSCGRCGGTIQCNGSCSVPTPSDFGQPCNVCGTVGCGPEGTAVCSRLAPCTLSDDLVLFWKLDEDAAQLAAADSSGWRHLGEYRDGPTPVEPGAPPRGIPSARARAFVGGVAGQAVVLPGPLPVALRPAQLTISVWYRAIMIKPGARGSELVSLGDNHLLRLTPSGFEGTKRTRRSGSGGDWVQCLPRRSNRDHLDDQWHHLAMTIDGNALTIYFDGQSICTRPNDAPAAYDIPGEFTVGRHGNRELSVNFDGVIDEVRLYARPLAPSEIANLANGAN